MGGREAFSGMGCEGTSQQPLCQACDDVGMLLRHGSGWPSRQMGEDRYSGLGFAGQSQKANSIWMEGASDIRVAGEGDPVILLVL